MKKDREDMGSIFRFEEMPAIVVGDKFAVEVFGDFYSLLKWK